MKKKTVFIVLVTFLMLYIGGENYYSEGKDLNQSKIDNFFETNVFDEAQEKHGIDSMGVGKSERILSIGMNDVSKQEEVQKYFERKLLNFGISDYEVEILMDEKM